MRDLLLGRDTVDLDIVVVDDAVALARALHAEPGGDGATRLRVHDAFGTATLILAEGWSLDLITARREHYPSPGALPIVTPGTLADDLRRRDFTINAMALTLDAAQPGLLLDPLGGRADLADGVVRVLHDGSFADDPTRILRGLRYGGRLAFAFDPHTAALCRAAVAGGALGTVSAQRLGHEFVRTLAEGRAAAILDRFVAYDLLARFPVPLRWDGATARAVAHLDDLWATLPPDRRRFALWEARFALLTATFPPGEARAAAAGLHLTAGAAALAEQVARLRAVVDSATLPASNSALGQLLDPFAPEALIAVAASSADDSTRAILLRYLTTVRPLAPALNGDALVALGVPPGPLYREALDALRGYKRDHPSVTADDERAFLLMWLAERPN